MSRNYLLYLRDILTAVVKIQTYLKDKSLEDLKKSDIETDGILFNLQIIGEAVKNIPDELRRKSPQVEWRNIGRFRDLVVHKYWGIDLAIIWDIYENDLPILKVAVGELISTLEQESKNSQGEDDNE